MLCCCGDVASCDPGPCPEEAAWIVQADRIAKLPDLPQQTVTAGIQQVSIEAPDGPGCGAPPGSVTYRCQDLGTGGERTLEHESTSELPDESRMFRYRETWIEQSVVPGYPTIPVPAVVERRFFDLSFVTFEQWQPADDWREQFPCLDVDDELMWRCFIRLLLSGTILEARGPSGGQANWDYEPIIRYVAEQTIYRDHDFRWRGCTLSGCCEWAPERRPLVSARRVDPPHCSEADND